MKKSKLGPWLKQNWDFVIAGLLLLLLLARIFEAEAAPLVIAHLAYWFPYEIFSTFLLSVVLGLFLGFSRSEWPVLLKTAVFLFFYLVALTAMLLFFTKLTPAQLLAPALLLLPGSLMNIILSDEKSLKELFERSGLNFALLITSFFGAALVGSFFEGFKLFRSNRTVSELVLVVWGVIYFLLKGLAERAIRKHPRSPLRTGRNSGTIYLFLVF